MKHHVLCFTTGVLVGAGDCTVLSVGKVEVPRTPSLATRDLDRYLAAAETWARQPRLSAGHAAVDLATGTKVSWGNNGVGLHPPAAANGRTFGFVTNFESGEYFGINMGNTDVKDLNIFPGTMDRDEMDIPQCTGIAVVDGRICYRSQVGIRCYDVRASQALKDGEKNPVARSAKSMGMTTF